MMISIKEGMNKIGPYGPKQQATINRYCLEGKIPSERKGDRWMLDEGYLEDAISWRTKRHTTEEMLAENEQFASLSEYDRKQCIRNVSLQTMKYLENDETYGLLFAGRIVKPEQEEQVRALVSETVSHYSDRAAMIPVAEAAERMGLSTYQLKDLIGKGEVRARSIKNDWYLEETEIDLFNGRKAKYIGLNDLVKEILPGVDTTFDIENSAHRVAMNSWMRKTPFAGLLTEWEELGVKGDRRNSLYVPADSRPQFEDLLRQFLRRYGNAENRMELLGKSDFWNDHPLTWAALQVFAEKKNPVGMTALMEILTVCLDSEIMDADNEEISLLLDYADNASTEIYRMYLAQFLSFVSKNYECRFDMVAEYRTGKAHKRTESTRPYDTYHYYAMAYMAFNEEFIREHGLIEKALKDPKMAFTWLRSVWQYTSMWRDVDTKQQIPVIDLKISREELRERILSGEFTAKDADKLSVLLETVIQD
ncbi:MAG: hypothetical protein ACI4D7_01050, partial [Lachnospiraceae bacterium]